MFYQHPVVLCGLLFSFYSSAKVLQWKKFFLQRNAEIEMLRAALLPFFLSLFLSPGEVLRELLIACADGELSVFSQC